MLRSIGGSTRNCSGEEKVRLNTRKILVTGGPWSIGDGLHGSNGTLPPGLLNQTKPWDWEGLGRRWR